MSETPRLTEPSNRARTRRLLALALALLIAVLVIGVLLLWRQRTSTTVKMAKNSEEIGIPQHLKPLSSMGETNNAGGVLPSGRLSNLPAAGKTGNVSGVQPPGRLPATPAARMTENADAGVEAIPALEDIPLDKNILLRMASLAGALPRVKEAAGAWRQSGCGG